MAIDATPAEIIVSALRLPFEERAQVVGALQESLVDTSIDHGPADDPSEVAEAWKEEIARRVADIASGSVKTIPADEAERMIRGNGRA